VCGRDRLREWATAVRRTAGTPDRLLHRALKDRLVQVVAAMLAREPLAGATSGLLTWPSDLPEMLDGHRVSA